MRRYCRCSLLAVHGPAWTTALLMCLMIWPYAGQSASMFRLDASGPPAASWVPLDAFEHRVSYQSGPGGSLLVHGDLLVTKPVDASSPLLMSAICTDTNFPLVRIETWDTTPQRVRYYAMRLQNVNVVSQQMDAEPGASNLVERVGLRYDVIHWTFMQVDEARAC